jgi:hypothetical protein
MTGFKLSDCKDLETSLMQRRRFREERLLNGRRVALSDLAASDFP